MMDFNYNYEDSVLELHDIALLLNYERATTESRFRHAKLREVASGGADFQTVKLPISYWLDATVPRTGFVFDKPRGRIPQAQENEPDLPTNILPTSVPANLQGLSPKELETYYWQARNHDGCFRTVTLFQHFVDLFPSELTRIRVRVVANNKPRIYTTLASDRMIIEMNLFQPKSMNISCVLPDNMTYTTGEGSVMIHAVLAFPPPTGDEPETILDMASLQFGDVGRGFKGRGLFVLEPLQQYKGRLNQYAGGNDFEDAKISLRINKAPDDEFLQDVAKRAKARWDKRKTEHWCGHCGAPPRDEPLKKCSKCQGAFYCNADHQLAAWTYHKHFCVDPNIAKERIKWV